MMYQNPNQQMQTDQPEIPGEEPPAPGEEQGGNAPKSLMSITVGAPPPPPPPGDLQQQNASWNGPEFNLPGINRISQGFNPFPSQLLNQQQQQMGGKKKKKKKNKGGAVLAATPNNSGQYGFGQPPLPPPPLPPLPESIPTPPGPPPPKPQDASSDQNKGYTGNPANWPRSLQ